MNEITGRTSMAPIVPVAQTPISIRLATMADLRFLDVLQKQHSKALGYFPTKQFEGYIEMGGVLVAEEPRSTEYSVLSTGAGAQPLGYCISRDRYLKRDELGVIYQLCVAPGRQRGLIGATLVKEVFARSAYGCRLYCCWCAQDLEANYFWESLGFVPIAFRAGSSGKKRVHIFWQRRIVADDTTTPWWYPFQTNAGAIREDRIVFPIPPGMHWKDVKAVAVPAARGLGILPEQKGAAARKRSGGTPKPQRAQPPGTVGILVGGRIKYVAKPGYVEPAPATALAKTAQKARRERKPKAPAAKLPSAKTDPKYLATAREFRDRYLERLNGSADALPAPAGKYDVGRSLPAPAAQATAAMGIGSRATRRLPSAA